MDSIVQSERGLVSSTVALNLTSAAADDGDRIALNASARERLCKRLLADRWLMQVSLPSRVAAQPPRSR